MTNADEAIIPQATLARVRKVVEVCFHGTSSRSSLSRRTRISNRHISYAVVAAKALGFLLEVDRTLQPTSLGEELARTSAGSEDEREVFIRATSQSESLRQIAPDLLNQQQAPDLEKLIKTIRHYGRIGEATARHRAAMIIK